MNIPVEMFTVRFVDGTDGAGSGAAVDAAGARKRKVTVPSSRTSGELSEALNGMRFSVFFCGL